MQQPTPTALTFDGQLPLRVILKLLFLSALGALLIVAHSLALLIAVALGFVMTLAVQERIRKLDSRRTAPGQIPEGAWVNDGGAFPGREPEAHSPISSPSVIDGGSLERLRH